MLTLARQGDIVQFYSNIGQISRKKRRDYVDFVVCPMKSWGNFRWQLVEILQIMSALGHTFLQEIYIKKGGHDDRAARMPLSCNYKLARPYLAPFLPKHCQISTRIFNWILIKFTLIHFVGRLLYTNTKNEHFTLLLTCTLTNACRNVYCTYYKTYDITSIVFF